MHQPAGRVWIVDDDPDARSLIEDILVEDGYEVQMCGDGWEALQVLRWRDFDVLLSDIRMPVVLGTELWAINRANSGPGIGGAR